MTTFAGQLLLTILKSIKSIRNECSYTESVCQSLSSHTKEEEVVEKLMQKYYVVYRSIAQSVLPAIIVIIVGTIYSN